MARRGEVAETMAASPEVLAAWLTRERGYKQVEYVESA